MFESDSRAGLLLTWRSFLLDICQNSLNDRELETIGGYMVLLVICKRQKEERGRFSA